MRDQQRQRGIAYIWVALLLVAMLGMLGLAIDVAYIVYSGQRLQTAADAAALAGGRMVRFDPAQSRRDAAGIAAQNTVGGAPVQLRHNTSNLEAGDIVLGVYDRQAETFTPEVGVANAVKVVARRTSDSLNGPLPLLFGPVLGVDETQLRRTAIAMVGGGTGAGLIVLDRTAPCGLKVSGSSATLSVVSEESGEAGSVIVNSAHDNALCHSGRPTIEAESIYVQGGYDNNFRSQVNYDGPIYTGSEPRPDPLASIPEPGYDPADDLGTVEAQSGETRVLEPGYYSGGITMKSNDARLELEPGIYVLDGVGLDVNGGDLIAEGVMFHIVDSTPNDSTESHVYLSGNGEIRTTPPDPAVHKYDGANIYEGIGIFQARDNTAEATIIGTNNMDLNGTLYFPSNHVRTGGTGDGFGTQLIANTLEVFGTGEVSIDYDGRFPAAGNTVFLVR